MDWAHRVLHRWIRRTLDQSWDRQRDPGMPISDWNRMIGETGEQCVESYLWREGKRVLYRNFQPRHGGEIDIVFRDGPTLVFGEVKTRSTRSEYRPKSAVDEKKRQLMRRGARAWLRMLDSPQRVPFRFDIFEVWLIRGARPKINQIERAFHLEKTPKG